MDDFRSRLRGGNESFKMGHVRGGSGSHQDLSYSSPTTPWDSGICDPVFINEALHHPKGPTYRGDVVYESIRHACTGKRDGEYIP
jgi:hypothetical protein